MALKTFTTADGSANQALVTNGSGVLSFAAVGASAGQIIQVVTATDSTERSTSSTSFVTGSNTLSVTITPSSASNKIYITCSTTFWNDGNNTAGFMTLVRGATDLGAASNKGLASYYGGYAENGVNSADNATVAILDSPNTTSATTYQLQFRMVSGTAVYINYSNHKASITAFEVKG